MAKSSTTDTYEVGALVVPINTYIPRPETDKPVISETDVERVLADITERMDVADGILELQPDLHLAMELRTSAILSPNDMMFTGLTLKANDAVYDDEEIAQRVINKIGAELNLDLDLDMKIPGFINDALFKHGAHIWFFLPPGIVDTLVANRLESQPSMESISVNDGIQSTPILTGIEFSDDFLAPVKYRINAAYDEYQEEVSLESYMNVKARPIDAIADEYVERRDSARPVIIEVPVDVCLPITNPSRPSLHQGYIILVDEHGHIVSRSTKRNYFKELAERLEAAIKTEDSAEYQKLKEMGFNKNETDRSISGLVELFNATIERKVTEAINGSGKKAKSFALDPDTSIPFYQIMFSRYMRSQKTRMIYVPARYIDYMAFDYDERGIGRSLLDKTKLFSSLRAIIMFSNLMGQVEASVPGTEINITLDEKDNDPMGTVMQAMALYGQAQDRSLPYATFNPMTLTDELRRYNTKVKVDGGNKFPNTQMEETKVKKDVPQTDSDILEEIKKGQYAGLSVPPEAIDQALQGEFAINTYTSNLMFMKRSALDAKIFAPQLARRIRTYITYTEPLRKMIMAEVGEDKLDNFIASLEVSLPHADTTRLEEQKAAFDAYVDFVDAAIEYYFSRDLMDGLLDGELSGNEDSIKLTFKAYFVRKYMADNNLLPELAELSIQGSDISARIGEYNKDMLDNIEKIIRGITKGEHDLDKKIAAFKQQLDAADNQDDNGGGDVGGADDGTGGADDAGTDDGTGTEDDSGDVLDNY